MYEITIHRSERDGLWYWHAQAGNHRIVGDGGEGYSSEASALRAATDFKAGIANATIRVERSPGTLMDSLLRSSAAGRYAGIASANPSGLLYKP